ncbi:MAG: hypothetical protein ACPGVB_10720, partial [Chitinophagales bacterium]
MEKTIFFLRNCMFFGTFSSFTTYTHRRIGFMEINEFYQEEVLRLSIAGDLDASSAIEMDEAIKKAFENERFKIVV